MKQKIFTTQLSALAEDGKTSHIVMFGVRTKYKHHSQTVDELKNIKKGQFAQQVIFKKTNKFSLSLYVAIKHPDDEYNARTLEKLIDNRIKKDDYHFRIESEQFIPDDLCQTIVNAEAEYIANNLEKYIQKMKAKYSSN